MLKSCPKRPGANGITSTLRGIVTNVTTGAQVKTTASARLGVKSSFIRTFSPCTVESSVPHGPTRSGPSRRFIRAMTFISMKMITKAIGGARRRSTVAANTNRTIGRLKTRMSRIWPPNSPTVTMRPVSSTAVRGLRTNSAFPGSVSRSQVRAITVIPRLRDRGRTAVPARSLVDAAHDRVQARHDRHRVGEEVAGQERAHRLEVDEARVVDLQAERLVRAVADGIRAVQP